MKNLPLLLCVSVLALPGCTMLGLAAGAGAAAGVAAVQEGGISRAASDARIQLEINELWFDYSVEAFRKLDLTINHGRVLVTGVVQNPEHRVEAIRLAWQPRGVEQVINEVRVADSEGVLGFAKDTWITSRLRAALTFDSEVLSVNYSIDTVQGTVYLMGFAQSQEELNRVIETARTISGVEGVVSYVKIVSGEGYQGNPQGYSSTAGQNVQPSYDPNSDPSLQPPPDAAINQPIVIAPQAEPTMQPVQEYPTEPYIVRDQPVVDGNARAREVQRQRIQTENQTIERESITWNP